MCYLPDDLGKNNKHIEDNPSTQSKTESSIIMGMETALESSGE
jgi:hypothetical protein